MLIYQHLWAGLPPTKTIIRYCNSKPWFTKQLNELHKDQTFREGDMDSFRVATQNQPAPVSELCLWTMHLQPCFHQAGLRTMLSWPTGTLCHWWKHGVQIITWRYHGLGNNHLLIPYSLTMQPKRWWCLLSFSLSQLPMNWETHSSHVVKQAHQRILFLRLLPKIRICPKIHTQFKRATIKSVLTFSITVLYPASFTLITPSWLSH